MAAVPVPGLPLDSIKRFFGNSSIGEVITMFSGGVLENATLIAIGLNPYINASVIFQLLGSVIPKIEELQKEGAQGRKIINLYTRLLTVPLAVLQSFVIYSLLRQYGVMGQLSTIDLIAMITSLTAGSVIMMWFGELISENGVGGGSSFLIFAGILAGIPGSLKNNLGSMAGRETAIFAISSIVIIFLVVFVTEAERRIPIQYARRVRTVGAAAESHIPIKLNQAGVMPVIFALSLLSFPQLIAKFLSGDKIPQFLKVASTAVVNFLGNTTKYNILLFVVIILFSFFYTFVVFNPANVAENLQKQAAFIPGVRPGKQTEKYLYASAARLAILGSLFLAAIAVLPSLGKTAGILSTTVVSGTGLLIVVSTVLEMKRQIESMIITRNYESYL